MKQTRKAPTTLTTVYEDNRVLLVIKPFGMPTQADETGDPDAQSIAKKMVNGYIGMFSRLDRPAGGLLLFAKDKKAAADLTLQFKEGEVTKQYAAIVMGCPDDNEGTLVHWLTKDRKSNRVTARLRPSPGAQKAETRFELMESDGKMSLLAVNPVTGRPHQIRAQLAAIGHPLWGDLKYGAPAPLKDKSVALFAYGLAFYHPTNEKRREFTLPLPKSWPFSL